MERSHGRRPLLKAYQASKRRNQVTDLDVQVWGEGVPAVLVHGSIATGEESWQGQRPLADEGFRLLVPDRRAYGDASDEVGEDFLQDAEDVAELLGDGAHLVGHSYGGLAALLAAARRPDAILSLAVVEPPAFALSRDDPAVAGFIAESKRLWAQTDLSDRAFLDAFLSMVGAPPDEIPDEMLEQWAGLVGPLRHGRPAWEPRSRSTASAPHRSRSSSFPAGITRRSTRSAGSSRGGSQVSMWSSRAPAMRCRWWLSRSTRRCSACGAALDRRQVIHRRGFEPG